MVPGHAIPTNRTVFVFDLRLTVQIVQLQGRFNANHDGNRCRWFARAPAFVVTLLMLRWPCYQQTNTYTHTHTHIHINTEDRSRQRPVPLWQVSRYCYKKPHQKWKHLQYGPVSWCISRNYWRISRANEIWVSRRVPSEQVAAAADRITRNDSSSCKSGWYLMHTIVSSKLADAHTDRQHHNSTWYIHLLQLSCCCCCCYIVHPCLHCN